MGSKASWWMSCFENTASQGNLNDRGLVRPDRSEDEPSGAKSFLVLHIQACWAEMGACSISVTGTRYEDVEARPWASWKATERTAQHTPRTTGSDSFLFCFVLFCFVLLPLCRIAGSWFPNQGSNAGHSNESTESCLDHHGIPKVFLIEERHGLMWRRSGELILLFILNFVYAIHSHVFKNRKVWDDVGFPGGASGKEPTCQCRRH